MPSTTTIEKPKETATHVQESVDRVKACRLALEEAKASLENMATRKTALEAARVFMRG